MTPCYDTIISDTSGHHDFCVIMLFFLPHALVWSHFMLYGMYRLTHKPSDASVQMGTAIFKLHVPRWSGLNYQQQPRLMHLSTDVFNLFFTFTHTLIYQTLGFTGIKISGSKKEEGYLKVLCHTNIDFWTHIPSLTVIHPIVKTNLEDDSEEKSEGKG